MSIAVGYAFCCLFFAALNDFVFKLFARKERSRGLFVAVAGSVWFALLAFLPWSPESDFGATLLWGAVSGALSVTSNLLLIEAMSHNSAGMCATIFRLNLVLVVLSAALLAVQNDYGFGASVAFGFASALGFTLAIVVFAGVRKKMAFAEPPRAFRGFPITLIAAGLLAMAFAGFAGVHL